MGAHPLTDAVHAGAESHTSHGRTFQHRENRILSALPRAELERLTPHLTRKTLEFKMPLDQPDEPITTVCFPDSGVCSVMAVMRNGASAEVATVGNEGMTGVGLFFGETEEPSQSLVQVPGIGRFLAGAHLRRGNGTPRDAASAGRALRACADGPTDAVRRLQRAPFGRSAHLQMDSDDTRPCFFGSLHADPRISRPDARRPEADAVTSSRSAPGGGPDYLSPWTDHRP